jgi:hypothetical protein
LDRPRRPLTPAALHLRTLRYYRELLGIGYRCALHPDPFPRSLRGERIALGIDVAELDTIPLWSTRRSDGALAIPMLGYILDSFSRCVEEFYGAIDGVAAGDSGDAEEAHQALRDELAAVLPRAAMDASVARLADVYIPADRLRRLCGPNGVLERILTACEALLEAGPGEPTMENRR